MQKKFPPISPECFPDLHCQWEKEHTMGDVEISLSTPSVVLKDLSRMIGSVVRICSRQVTLGSSFTYALAKQANQLQIRLPLILSIQNARVR